MPSGETASHKRLKALALSWAREKGYVLAAPEVSFPHRRFRFDVAACVPARRAPAKKPAPITSILKAAVVFECKQGRGDLLKDNKRREESKARLKELLVRKTKLERLLSAHLPHLAKGESLFPEFDSYRFEDHEHEGYRSTVRSICQLQSALVGSVKFDKMREYRVANLHYLVVEPGLVRDDEVPVGWGVLERSGEELAIRQNPGWHEIGVEEQLVFLQRVAMARVGKAS